MLTGLWSVEKEDDMSQNQITPQMLEDGFRQLDQLAVSEYGRNLPELAESLKEKRGPEDVFELLYFGRLLGIVIKQPFSEVRLLETKKHWELLPERLKEPRGQATWQFQLIVQLQQESLDYPSESYLTLEEMIEEVKHETGFFWHVLRSLRKYICGDPEFSQQMKETIDDLRRSGTGATLPSASIAATLATLLATQVPWLGITSAPLITGVVLVFWRIGCDAFCSWSDEIIKSRLWSKDS
jgi:hypothetical protein